MKQTDSTTQSNQLHIVINATNRKDLQQIASLLSDYEIESLTWGPPKKPTNPVYRGADRAGGFVEAARGIAKTNDGGADNWTPGQRLSD